MAPFAGYVRVSHVGGRSGDRFHSPDEQAAAICRKARELGSEVELLAPDLNRKGSDPERQTLLEAIAGVESGRYAGIIVASLSRASRRTRHTLEMWDRVKSAGGRLIAVAEGVDTAVSTPAAKLQRTILAAIAEHELDTHAERFEALRRSATARGLWQARQTPLGYSRDAQTRRLVPDERAGDVQRAFRDRAAGKSVMAIAQELGMTTSGVRFLFANRVYRGELRVGAHVNLSAHPALVSEESLLAVMATRTIRPARVAPAPALLAGLVRCCGCGHVMSRAHTKAEVYVCHRHHSAGACPAPAAVTLHRLDAHVERIALSELARLSATPVEDDGALREARERVAAAEAELRGFLSAVDAAGIGEADFTVAARARREALDEARGRLGALAASEVPAVDGDPLRLWESLAVGLRNQLLRGLFETVLVRRAGGRGRVVPLDTRVRVIAAGTGLVRVRHWGGKPQPIATVALPEPDDPTVLGVPVGEDRLEHAGG